MDFSIREKDLDNSRSYKKADHSYRKRARSRRKQSIEYKNIAIIAALTLAVIAASFVVYNKLPFVKVKKAIAAGDKYTANEDYESAIDSYTEAIEIDSKSVAAYSNMASAFLSIDDSESAKKILYDGWQNTDNKALLTNYLTVILNDAVNAINRQEADIDTIADIVNVLEQDGSNQDAIELLNAAYDRCFTGYENDINALFYAANSADNFSKYQDIVNRLVTVYESNPSDDIRKLVLKYTVPAVDEFAINCEDVTKYEALLEKVEQSVGLDEKAASFKACLSDSQNVLGIFSEIFKQLDVGNVDELRNFVVSDEYITLRNKFLNNEETYLENTTYIPISREGIVLKMSEESYSYRFLNFDDNKDTLGVLTLWANFFEDNGVQRNSISYEPAAINGNYYPHTKYSVTYLNSYITSGNSTKVEKMNYRLDTLITYEDGTVDETIVGDWGGANEWIMDIDTIESRIKA